MNIKLLLILHYYFDYECQVGLMKIARALIKIKIIKFRMNFYSLPEWDLEFA